MLRKLAALVAVVMFAFPAIVATKKPAADAPVGIRAHCTQPPKEFDGLTDRVCRFTKGADGQCAFVAPKAGIDGNKFVWRGCAVIMVQDRCQAEWRPQMFVCTALLAKPKTETL